ncbi:MAG: hypothetical protein AAGC56_05075 [Pseudomonadota bacterium]
MIALLAAASAAFLALSPADRNALSACSVDADALQAYLEMEQGAFDQDLDGGWRAVSSRDGCEDGAGVLISAYIQFSVPKPPEAHRILRWHAGQVFAGVDRTDRALAFFAGSYEVGPGAQGDDWDQYVDATIAFLQRDRDGLQAARNRLAAMAPSTEEIAEKRAYFEANPDVAAMFPNWREMIAKPQNIDVVDGLIACFDKPYREAYGGSCRGR